MRPTIAVITALGIAAIAAEASTSFYTWDDGSAFSHVTNGSPSPYSAGAWYYLQGDANNSVYEQVTGTIPEGAEVTIDMRMVDFHQSWSTGATMSFGFFTSAPTTGNIASGFVYSGTASVPNYNAASPVTDGLPEGAAYQATFTTTADLVNPYFVVRKDTDVARIGIDNISVTFVPEPSVALLGGLGLMALLRRRR